LQPVIRAPLPHPAPHAPGLLHGPGRGQASPVPASTFPMCVVARSIPHRPPVDRCVSGVSGECVRTVSPVSPGTPQLPSRRTAGCVLDPARVDIRKVKCDSARGRSDLLTDGSDRAEARTAFCSDDGVLRKGGQLLVPTCAIVRSSGRVFCRLARSCRGSGDFPNRGKHSGRRPGDFLYRRPRSCGGPTAFCTDGCIPAKPPADFRTGSRHSQRVGGHS
jgi:hypothetical protein